MAWFRRSPQGLEDLHRHLKEELARNPFLGGAGGRSRRAIALTAPPQALGVDPETVESDVWSVVIDTLYPTGLVSLVVARADLAALVFGTGVTLRGRGPAAERAGLDLLETATALIHEIPTADSAPIPPTGSVAIHVRTSRGIHRAEATEGELVSGGHALSPIHRAALRIMAYILDTDAT